MKRHTYIRIGVFWFFLFFSGVPAAFSHSPSGTIGNWTAATSQIRVSDDWSIHTEFQFRSYEVYPKTEELMIRPGINYHLSDSAIITAGYAYIPRYVFDKAQSDFLHPDENRVWEQFLMTNSVRRFFFEHRYRLEQRWIGADTPTGSTRYLNRIRYMIRVSIPLNTQKMEKGTWFLNFYDELFMNIVQNPFDRNRLYGAIGYQFAPSANVQLGYMVQTVGAVTKPYFQLALFYNIDLRKK